MLKFLRIIRWAVYASIIGGLIYACSLFFTLSDQERSDMATGARDAFQTNVLEGPLAGKIKEDLKKKKASFIESAREGIKGAVDRLMGGEEEAAIEPDPDPVPELEIGPANENEL